MKTIYRIAFEKRQKELNKRTAKFIAALLIGFSTFVITMVYLYGIY